MKTHTICRLCSACCPVEVETENGKWVKAVRKYRFPDEPHLRCPKLEKAADILYAPDRLTRPLIKKPDGAFREASWDEALDAVARQFLRCKGNTARSRWRGCAEWRPTGALPGTTPTG